MGRELIKNIELDATRAGVGGHRHRARHRRLVRAAPRGAEGQAGDERSVRRRRRRDRPDPAWEPGGGSPSGPPSRRPTDADYAFEFLVEGRDGGGDRAEIRAERLPRRRLGRRVLQLRRGLEPVLREPAQLLRPLRRAAGAQRGDDGLAAGTAADALARAVRRARARRAPRSRQRGHPRPDGPPPITGVVDVDSEEFLGVRSASGLHRFGAEGDAGCGVSAYHYFYGEPVDAARSRSLAGLAHRLFPAPEPTATA